MERGNFTFSNNFKFNEVDVKGEKKLFLEGFISTDDKDLVNDIVTEKCMDSMIKQIKDRTIKLDFEHESFRGETDIEMEINKTKIPLGKRIDWERKDNGVKVTWEVNPTWKKFDEKGNVVMDYKDIKYNVEEGYYDAFSIAFVPTNTTKAKSLDGSDVRLLDGINLLNVALTGNPINPAASMTNVLMKSRDYVNKALTAQSFSNNNQTDKKEDRKMSENNEKKEESQEQPEAEESKEEAKDEAKEESKEESKEETKEEATAENVEAKSLVEIKSIKKEVSLLKSEMSEIKSLLIKPLMKSKVEVRDKSEENKTEDKSVGPLDLI